MAILEQLEKDFIRALKEKKETEVLALRQIKAAIKNAEIAKIGKLTEEELIKLLRSEIKKIQDAALDFKKGSRLDLVQKSEKELAIISRYLPPALAEEQAREIIENVIKKSGAAGPKDFGKVMGKVMTEIKGQLAGDKASALVKEELEKLNS